MASTSLERVRFVLLTVTDFAARRAALAVLPLVLPWIAQGALHAQTSGPAPGHRLFSPLPLNRTLLIDNAGTLVHSWDSDARTGIATKLTPWGTVMRAIYTGGPVINPGQGGGVQEQDFEGNVIWEYHYSTSEVRSHHDLEVLPNGNVLMVAWDFKTEAEAVAAGRNPAKLESEPRFGHVVELQKTGPRTANVVWEWYVFDHLIQDFDATKANFGVVSENPGRIDMNYPPGRTLGSLNHLNGIDYDPVNDVIILSAAFQDEIWIIDHSTTTAEAAGSTGGNYGRGGDLLYRWGNPEAYQRGTSADQKLFFQHSPRFIPPSYPGGGHVTVFNNQAPGGSQVVELELPLDPNGQFVLPVGGTYGPDAPVWTYAAPGFQSNKMSSAQRLPNGNTLIASSLQSRIFEVDPVGNVVWDFDASGGANLSMFNVEYVERTMWDSRDTISMSSGGTIEFDLVAGSPQAGNPYILLGSLSGTSPGVTIGSWNVPLNNDGYMRHLFRAPATPYHVGTLGTLDALGNASSSMTLPASLFPSLVGLTFHHAYLTAPPGVPHVSSVSNVESVVIGP